MAETVVPAARAHRYGPPWRRIGAVLKRVEWLLDESEVSRTAGAQRIRIAVGSLFLVYGVVLEVVALTRDDVQLAPLAFVIGSAPILLGRLGRLGRYFVPVGLGLYAYAITASYAVRFKLGVHYTPQIDADRALGFGTVPTVWLQHHLYHGVTGPLETLAVVVYLGHFVIPLALGAALALSDRANEFKFLMFSILTVAVLGAFTFVLAPTAPPWLAAQDGHLLGVQHILKASMGDLHMSSLASLDGDPSKYDITAAVPSLHAAFPIICLAVAIRARLPRIVPTLIAIDFCAVVFAIVYTGEHYLVDALAGVVYALVSLFAVDRLLRTPSVGEPPKRLAASSPEASAAAPAPGQAA